MIDLDGRRRNREYPADLSNATGNLLIRHYRSAGRELANLASPVFETFHACQPDLEQHLKGAFLRWQMEQIKRELEGQPHEDIAVGLAIAVCVQAFADRMIEIELGFDPA